MCGRTCHQRRPVRLLMSLAIAVLPVITFDSPHAGADPLPASVSPPAVAAMAQDENDVAPAWRPRTAPAQPLALVQRLALASGYRLHDGGERPSWSFKVKRLSAQASSWPDDPGFSAIGRRASPMNDSQRRLSLRYHLSPLLSFAVISKQSADSRGLDSQSDLVELRVAPRNLPRATLFLRSWTDEDAPPGSSSSASAGWVLAHAAGSTQFNLRYERRLPGSSYSFDRDREDVTRFSAGVVQTLGSRTTLAFSHIMVAEAARHEVARHGADHLVRFTSMDLSQGWGNKGLTLDFGLQHRHHSQDTVSGGPLAARAGLNIPVGEYGFLGISYQTRPFAFAALGTEIRGADGLSIDLRISRRF